MIGARVWYLERVCGRMMVLKASVLGDMNSEVRGSR